MRGYAGDLGVECEFCHAAPDPVTHRADRASDANPMKETARFMIEMTDDLNTKYLAEMPSRRYADPITCGTCHRGEKHPSIFVPPPRPEGNRPPGSTSWRSASSLSATRPWELGYWVEPVTKVWVACPPITR